MAPSTCIGAALHPATFLECALCCWYLKAAFNRRGSTSDTCVAVRAHIQVASSCSPCTALLPTLVSHLDVIVEHQVVAAEAWTTPHVYNRGQSRRGKLSKQVGLAIMHTATWSAVARSKRLPRTTGRHDRNQCTAPLHAGSKPLPPMCHGCNAV